MNIIKYLIKHDVKKMVKCDLNSICNTQYRYPPGADVKFAALSSLEILESLFNHYTM